MRGWLGRMGPVAGLCAGLCAVAAGCGPSAPPRGEPYDPPDEPPPDYGQVEEEPPPVEPGDSGAEPVEPDPPGEDETDAGRYTGAPRVVYGAGSFFFGGFTAVDPTTDTPMFALETEGSTGVGCAGAWLGALVSSFTTSGLLATDPDGAPAFQAQRNDLTFPSAFTVAGGRVVVADEGLPSLATYDLAGTPTGALSLAPVADNDGLAEPRWLVQAADGALWVGVDRYNQLIGGSAGDGAAIAVVEAGADRASDAWPLGTDTITSPQVVAHGGRLWIGSLGHVTTSGDLMFDGALLAFDLQTRTLTPVLGGGAFNHVAERLDGGGVWASEALPSGQSRVVAVDWDGTVGASVPAGEFPRGIGEDGDGRLWIADDRGVRTVDPATGEVIDEVERGEFSSLRVCR